MTRNQIRITLLSRFALVAALIASRPVAAQDAKQPYPNMAPIEQYLMGMLGGTRMDGHVRSSRVLESKSPRRGMHQSTSRSLRPALCLQTHRIAARRRFQTRSHRRNQSRNRQKRITSPGAGDCLLHDVEGFVSQRLRRPQRPAHDVLRNSERRCSLGRKSHKLPSSRRKLLVHLRRSLPTTQILPTTVSLPGRSNQMVRWNAGTEHVKT
jgi:hypothetical protein